MKKNEKKLSSGEKKSLRFLIEDFLEKESTEISSIIKNPVDAHKLWDQFEVILFKDTFWMDEVEPEDINGTDFEKLILNYHELLKPVWDKLKESIFDYKYRIIPEREKLVKFRKKKEKDVKSVLYEYRDLLNQDCVIDWEKYYNIDIKITVSFETSHITFYKRTLDALNNFLDLLRNIPIYYFIRCENCGKCIILTRTDKRFKERDRYLTKRKRSVNDR